MKQAQIKCVIKINKLLSMTKIKIKLIVDKYIFTFTFSVPNRKIICNFKTIFKLNRKNN